MFPSEIVYREGQIMVTEVPESLMVALSCAPGTNDVDVRPGYLACITKDIK